jgi:FkbM family methyltransferase
MLTQLREKVRTYYQNIGLFETIGNYAERHFRSTRQGGTWLLRSRLARHPLWCRAASSDYFVFQQIFTERVYSCFDDLENVNLILDLGANVGFSSAYFLSRFPSCTVLAVEPDAQNFAMLEKNLKPYADRAKLVQGAAWSESTTLHFETSSLQPMGEWGRRVSSSEVSGPSIKAYDIASLLRLTSHDRFSIVKMDIEGAEQEVFSRNYKFWLDCTDNICIELHGDACKKIFHEAIEDRNFILSNSGELTVCKTNAKRG